LRLRGRHHPHPRPAQSGACRAGRCGRSEHCAMASTHRASTGRSAEQSRQVFESAFSCRLCEGALRHRAQCQLRTPPRWGEQAMADQTAQRIHTYCGLCIARCGAVAVVEDGRFTRLRTRSRAPHWSGALRQGSRRAGGLIRLLTGLCQNNPSCPTMMPNGP
jgi:hypothetical protein